VYEIYCRQRIMFNIMILVLLLYIFSACCSHYIALLWYIICITAVLCKNIYEQPVPCILITNWFLIFTLKRFCVSFFVVLRSYEQNITVFRVWNMARKTYFLNHWELCSRRQASTCHSAYAFVLIGSNIQKAYIVFCYLTVIMC
jgi:hypothetical protein